MIIDWWVGVGSSLTWIEVLSPLCSQPDSPIGSFSYSSLRLLIAKKSSWEPMRFVYFEAFAKKPLKRLAALPSSKVKMVGGRSMVREVVETDIDRVCLFELNISLCWRKWPWFNNHQCKGLMFGSVGVKLVSVAAVRAGVHFPVVQVDVHLGGGNLCNVYIIHPSWWYVCNA